MSTKQKQKSPLLRDGFVTIISPQSLRLLQDCTHQAGNTDGWYGVDLLVLDESESTLQQMAPSTTHKDNFKTNWSVLQRLVCEAKYVLSADAFLSDRTLNLVAALRGGRPACLLRNMHRAHRGTALHIDSSGRPAAAYRVWEQKLLCCLQQKERLYVVVTSEKVNNELFDKLTGMGYRVLQHTGMNRNEKEVEDVNESWALFDVVTVTLTITVGTDYNCNPEDESKQFDRVFVCQPQLWARARRAPVHCASPEGAQGQARLCHRSHVPRLVRS